METDRPTGRDQNPVNEPETLARQVVDTVESLVTLWFTAAEDVVPQLSARQLFALQTVRRRPELNLTALAEHLEIGLPTASRLCGRLVSAGLLQRTVQPHNRREVRLVVTADGRRFLADVTERRSRCLATVFEAMTPGERASLQRGLGAFQQARARTRPQPRADGQGGGGGAVTGG
ncbi:MarR family transcriptional regulator [Streptomyces phaeochromogenes]|uniref:MarR family transcriptional regulator n=1 Tax=Streptomyces phaeochromogenes TaxID=1923 RepID=A0ABZ1HP62_STRPH|nr:MarR family transcriptional regulator [Streptomyces phaeochromogenes]MCX5599621.1 MarR family transcriptional regulator [Streptomyces phaeochromogenes]WSD20401.1 MarR family transcriptional regulator [Streptomyces phaeochromogenes]WSJ02907.1 MarR family transcriptional regulator [Streptomyces phaeochromogenes]